MSPYDTLHGCELAFPDTAFIDAKGKITEIIKTDKDGFLVTCKQPQKLKQQSIRRNFATIVRERRRQYAIQNEMASFENALKRVKEMHTALNSPNKTKNGFSLDNTERSIDQTIFVNDMEL